MSEVIEDFARSVALQLEIAKLRARVTYLEKENKRLRKAVSDASSDHSWELEYLRNQIPISHEMGR